jgi:hypothetical protein
MSVTASVSFRQFQVIGTYRQPFSAPQLAVHFGRAFRLLPLSGGKRRNGNNFARRDSVFNGRGHWAIEKKLKVLVADPQPKPLVVIDEKFKDI